jgi:hypothetical protein
MKLKHLSVFAPVMAGLLALLACPSDGGGNGNGITPAPAAEVVSIAVTQSPAKTTYAINEAFDPAGLVITATYSDNSSKTAIGYTMSTPDMGTPGQKTITVTFDGKTATFSIIVNPPSGDGGLDVIIY